MGNLGGDDLGVPDEKLREVFGLDESPDGVELTGSLGWPQLSVIVTRQAPAGVQPASVALGLDVNEMGPNSLALVVRAFLRDCDVGRRRSVRVTAPGLGGRRLS